MIQLGGHINTQKGYAFKSKWYSDDGHPIVKVSDFTDNSIDSSVLAHIPQEIANEYRKYELRSNDVVIQTVGSWPSNPASVVGKTIRVPSTASGALLNQNAVKVEPDNTIDKGFLYYLLRDNSFKEYIVGTAQGAASQASITLDSIRAFKFSCPALEVQRNIAEVLSSYDNQIENNNHRIAILEEMVQSLYHEWFVKFRFPSHENTKFIDSTLGKIPEGWEVNTIKGVLQLAYGKALKKADRKGGDIAVYGSGGVGGYHNEALVDGPCIIVGRKGNVGSVFWSESDIWPIDTVFYVKSDISHYFLYYNLLGQTFHNSDAAVPGLNRESAYSNKIILPPVHILTVFDLRIKPIFKFLYLLRRKNENLISQRDHVLPNLISGKINFN